MLRTSVLLASIVVAVGAALQPSAASRTEVLVVSSMHGLHKNHPSYTYDDLYRVVRDFKPEHVGVEIRPEDVRADRVYLEANYPAEMIALAIEFGSRAFGFDWLGDDVAGRPVPGGWWRNGSPIKALERELDKDAAFRNPELEAFGEQRTPLLKNATPASLNNGRYDALTRDYYARLARQLAGTRYQAITDFYAERDRHIADNIAAAAHAHRGSRIVLVLGADHRGPVVARLRADPSVAIVPVTDPARRIR